MKAQFLDLHAAADFLGPGAIEVKFFPARLLNFFPSMCPQAENSSKCVTVASGGR